MAEVFGMNGVIYNNLSPNILPYVHNTRYIQLIIFPFTKVPCADAVVFVFSWQ